LQHASGFTCFRETVIKRTLLLAYAMM